jgi:hypothetical protein
MLPDGGVVRRALHWLSRIPRGGRLALLLAYWLALGAWLVADSYPHWLDRSIAGYRSVFSEGLLVMDRWMTIRFQDQAIGYSHTAVDVNEENPLAQYTMDSRTILNLNLMGQRQRVSVSVKADLDSFYALHRFLFILSSQNYSVSITGTRKEEELFDLVVRSEGHVERTTIRIPDDAVLYSPMTETALKALRPGHEAKLKVFNPISMTTETIVLKSLREEPYTRAGRSEPATVVAMNYMGMEVLSWVSREGEILRQETPYGWVMESATAEEALAAPAEVGSDLMRAMAVPASGLLDRDAPPHTARLRLRGIEGAAYPLATQRQHVFAATGTVVELMTRAVVLPVAALSLAEAARAQPADLADAQGIQATDPAIVQRAREIVGAETNSLRAALALHEWVNRRVLKKPTVSLPSALDVLRNLEGDCNEHTYLYVALARAAGLPARIRVGLMYSEGAFYYHAWPTVYVGRWLDLDPTLGQPAADALHVSLLEGEIKSQMNLLPLLGRLRVDVLGTNEPWPAAKPQPGDPAP